MLPPAARRDNPADSIPAKYLHTSFNKVKHPVNVVKWTPEGRRLLTASTSGEFTLWNGTGFNFETIMQAHDCAIRALKYTHNDDWLLSADQDGVVKYWQTNFNNVKDVQAHNDPIRDIAIAPTDIKFVTASDDASLKIFDFATGAEETTITGHQWEAKCVDWHPSKGLIASGSKDHQIKLWDPRNGRCLTTLHGHKNTLASVRFQPTEGNLLASCAREPVARVFDIRMMRDVFLLKGHEKEIASLVWHPFHATMLSTGGADGSLLHYLLNEQNRPEGTALSISPYDARNPKEAAAQPLWPRHKLQYAHDFAIWSMDWHPLGHLLATGANDKATRFWTRPRPGDDAYTDDRWHIGQTAAEAKGTWKKSEAAKAREDESDDEAEALPDQNFQSRAHIPGLPGINSGSLPGIMTEAPPMPMVAPPQTGMPNMPPAPTPEQLQQLFGNMPPPLPGQPFPLLPGMAPGQLPPGFPPFPPHGLPGMPLINAIENHANSPSSFLSDMSLINALDNASGVRKRGPLPSQQESLQAEMKQGRYNKIR